MPNENNVKHIVSEIYNNFYSTRCRALDLIHKNATAYEINDITRLYFETREQQMLRYLGLYPEEDITEANRQFEFIRHMQLEGYYSPN